MTTRSQSRVPRLGVLGAALSMVFPLAWSADVDELTELTKPESSLRLGLGYLTGDNPPFGLYSGVNKQGTYGAAGFNYVRRDDSSGTWYRASGRNLGLNGPEARIEHERQGDWGYFIDFNRISRFDPLRIDTGLTGIDTANQAINGTPRREVRLSTERDRFRLGLDKKLNHGLDFQLRYSTESKNGSRLFGRGTGEFLAEPINSRTHQVEAILGYTGEALQLSGGYYGTAYKNQYSVIDVLTGTDIALAPDNQSHQLYLSGGYSFTPTTRATFKIAQGRGLQNESFFTAPDFPGNVQSGLNGRVDTKSAQFGLSARPLPKLSVLMNLRYEDRDDKTPRYQFLAASTGRDGFNTPFSRTTRNAKLEASYPLPLDLRLTGGVEVDERKRSVLAIRQVSWREKNDETSYRVELRRSLSDTLNGALSVVHSDRGGSDYLPANNAAAADVIDPLHFADRKRNKLRLSLDWMATESLTFQLLADEARDTYNGRPLGPELGKARMLSLDADYRISEDWHSVAWISRDRTDIHQSTLTGANGTAIAAQLWQARLRNVGDALGVGLRGKPTGKLEVGVDLQWARDLNSYGLLAAVPDAARLPDIDSRRYTLRMFANYELQKNLGVRLDLIHDRFRTNDWIWTGWTYADGTTVTQDPRLNTTFVGVSMTYRAVVSRYVGDLESRLGVRLLHRTTRRLSLTAEGLAFHARCKELLQGIDEAEAEITSGVADASGLLRVNAPVSFGIRYLAPQWPAFRALHPKVTLDVTLSDRVVDLLEEGYDLAIRIAALPSSTLISKRLSRSRTVLCASPRYLDAHGAPRHPGELADHAIIAYSYWSTRDEWHFDGPQGGVSVRTRPCIQTNNGDTCLAAALAHHGVTLLPTFLIAEDLASGRLVEIMPEFRSIELGIHAVYPTRKHVPLKVRRLIDFLVESFRTAPWLG